MQILTLEAHNVGHSSASLAHSQSYQIRLYRNDNLSIQDLEFNCLVLIFPIVKISLEDIHIYGEMQKDSINCYRNKHTNYYTRDTLRV